MPSWCCAGWPSPYFLSGLAIHCVTSLCFLDLDWDGDPPRNFIWGFRRDFQKRVQKNVQCKVSESPSWVLTLTLHGINSNTSPPPIQFSQYLHENASYVRPLEEGMLHLFESITEDTVTVLVTNFPPCFTLRETGSRSCCPIALLTMELSFYPGDNCEIENVFRSLNFLHLLP